VPYYPEEDSKLRATNLQVRRGGNCPNTLEVLQQLLRNESEQLVTPHLISCMPTAGSPATKRILESFGSDTPVDFSRCIYRDCDEPASSYIMSAATGSRTLVNYNNLPEMTYDEFTAIADEIGDNAWFHFEVCPNMTNVALDS
jgi:ketohexokinase